MSTATKLGRGKNHSGYTTQLPNGRYRTFLMYKGKTVSAVGSTPKESKALAVAKRDNLPQAIGKLPKQVLNLKLIDFMPDWLHDKHRKKVAPTTYKRYVGLMENWVLPSLGHIKVVELNKHHVNAFIESMESKVGPRSQQQAKALLSAAFAFLVKKEWVSDNPVLKSDEVVCEKKEINPLTYEEVKKLIGYVRGTFWHARWVIACFYGLRQGEALGLRWSNVNLETGELQVREQLQTIGGVRQFVGLKSKASTRTLQLDPQTVVLLKAHKKEQLVQRLSKGEKWKDWDLVFPKSDGSPLHPKVDYKAWQDALQACGISRHRLHDARHTAATFLFDQGLDVEVIRRLLGNSSVELTAKTYVHHSKKQFTTAAQIIGLLAI